MYDGVFSWHPFRLPGPPSDSLSALTYSVLCSSPLCHVCSVRPCISHCWTVPCFLSVSSVGFGASASRSFCVPEGGQMLVDEGPPEGRAGGARAQHPQ